ncbi:hypothetical protein HFN89_00040 [Rhizobium laguerreae]|nr:hypothetical protein [Rhizobium laguerreae]
MTTFHEFGPFVGMTYAGRQAVESVAKQAASLAKTALVRASERQKDTPSAENIVICGRLGYARSWKIVRSGRGLLLALMAASFVFLGVTAFILGFGCTEYIDFSPLIASPKPNEKFFGMLFAPVSAIGSIIAAALTVRDLRHGSDPHDAQVHFGRTARQMWGIGEKALYIVSDELVDDRTKTATVFYDAVGTVDIERNEDGIDVITLRSRDGSLISEFVDPVTSATSNAKVIVDAITERIASVKR